MSLAFFSPIFLFPSPKGRRVRREVAEKKAEDHEKKQ
jgi:hypothetical protein